MTETRKPFTRAPAGERREALIRATLALMAEVGPAATTVRAITDRAGISQGMIRHYFQTKEDLIGAAYEWHMRGLTGATDAAAGHAGGSARERLARFVGAALTPPVVDAQAMSLWAGFIHMVLRDPRMRAVHERTYRHFRDRLQALIEAALREVGRPAPPDPARRHAIACNAVLDGLWLEGCALPEAFGPDELTGIGLRAVSAILDLDLAAAGAPSTKAGTA